MMCIMHSVKCIVYTLHCTTCIVSGIHSGRGESLTDKEFETYLMEIAETNQDNMDEVFNEVDEADVSSYVLSWFLR